MDEEPQNNQTATDESLNQAAAATISSPAGSTAVAQVKDKEILSTFTEEWITETAAQKDWAGKKERITQIVQELESADTLLEDKYFDIVALCKKFSSDANPQVCNNAIKSIGHFVRCLRNSPQGKEIVKDVFPHLMKKLTDKKLVDETQQTFSQFTECMNLLELKELLLTGLENKIPMIQRQSSSFLQNALRKTYVDIIEDIEPEVFPVLLKLIKVQDTEAREVHIRTLGVFLMRLGGTELVEQHSEGLTPTQKKIIDDAVSSIQRSKYDETERKRTVPSKIVMAPKTQEIKNKEVSPSQEQEAQPEMVNQEPAPFHDPTDIPLNVGKKDPMEGAYPPGEKPPAESDELLADFSAPPKKVGKMPNFSKSNKGAAKKKAEGTAEEKKDEASDKKDDVEMSEDQPAAVPFHDPSDIPLNVGKKDPMEGAYPPGEKPPADDELLGGFSGPPKKVGKMPNFSKSNKGAAKKKAEETDKKDDVEMSEEQPVAAPFHDPSDIPLNVGKKDPMEGAYPPGEKPPADDELLGDFSGPPKKVGKMPNFSKGNKGAAKKKAEEKKEDVEMSEDQPAAVQYHDPSDIPLNVGKKDPMAGAYPPGEGPPPEDDLPINNKSKKDPMEGAYPPGMKAPDDMNDLKNEMSATPKAKKPALTQKKKEMPSAEPMEESKDDGQIPAQTGFVPNALEDIPLSKGQNNTDEFATEPVAEKVYQVKSNPVRPPPPAGKGDDGEDDKGGMSSEEATSIVEGFFHAENVACFKAKDWKGKVEGLKGFQVEIKANKPDVVTIEAMCRFIKTAMKDWKESNMNMIKESINSLNLCLENCERIPKRAMNLFAPFVVEKIGDTKYQASIIKMADSAAEYCGSKFVATQMLKTGSKSKVPKNLEQLAIWLTKLLDEWGSAQLPLKETIDFAIIAAGSTSGPVRVAALKLFGMLYKHMGDPINNYLEGIKDSTKKLIDAEFKNITPLKKGEFKGTKVIKDPNEAAAAAAGGGGDDGLPRENISKLITPKLLKGFTGEKPDERSKTVEEILSILKGAKMRIEFDGLHDLTTALEKSLKEANKAVLKANIGLIGVFAEALGPASSKLIKKLLVPLLKYLSDKQTLVRQKCIESMNKWALEVGNENVIPWLIVQLVVENPELRLESLKWVLEHKEDIKKADHTVLPEPLTGCLIDRDAKVRKEAEKVIIEVMPFTGFEPFSRKVMSFKPAQQQDVKKILEAAKKASAVAAPASAAAAPAEVSNNKPEEVKKIPGGSSKKPEAKLPGPTPKANAPVPQNPTRAQPAPVEQQQPAEPRKPMVLAQPASLKQPESLKAKETENKTKAPNTQRPGATNAKQTLPEVDPDEFLVVNPGDKEKRAKKDMSTKWFHDEMQAKQTDKVKHDCEAIFGIEFMQKMFTTDFKKHGQIVASLNAMIAQQPENLIMSIDVVFKWGCIKLAESSNSTFSTQLFDFYSALFQQMITIEYQLWDNEAFVVVPFLCHQTGTGNAIIKEKIKELCRMCFKIYDHKQLLALFFSMGLTHKNMKSVAEVIDILTWFVKEDGVDKYTEKNLQAVTKLLLSTDKTVAKNALEFVIEVHKEIDEALWKVIGKINDQQKTMIENRIKMLRKGTNQDMNRSINSSIGGPTSSRRSIGGGMTPKVNLNQSINKNMSQTLNSQREAATPRRTAVIKPGNSLQKTKEGMNSSINSQKQSGLGSLSKAKDQMNTSSNALKMNTSINAINGQMNTSNNSRGTLQPPSRVANRQSGASPLPRSPRRATANQILTNIPADLPEPQEKIDKTSFVINDDDKDILEKLEALENPVKPEEVLDPIVVQQIDFIKTHIDLLKYGDLSKRVDSLVALNDIISRISSYHTQTINRCANDLCSALTHVLVETFEKSLQDIPLRFAKYFVTITNRVCTSPEVMMAAGENECFELCEQLLQRLLTEGLDKLGEGKEGENILKTLNAAMLRLLENCQPTYVYCALYNLLKKYKDFTVLPKLPGLVIKCLLKLAKIIEKQSDSLETEKILLVIHEYLLIIDHENKTQTDEMGIRITKTIINELVKIRGQSIWESYKLVDEHSKQDTHIKRWLQLILTQPGQTPAKASEPTVAIEPLDTPKPQNAMNQSVFVAPQQNSFLDEKQTQLNIIMDELQRTDLFEGAIEKLHQFLLKYPQDTLDHHLRGLSPHFCSFIKQHLEMYQAQLQPAQPLSPKHQTFNQFTQQRPSLAQKQQPLTTTNAAFQRPQTSFNNSGPGYDLQEENKTSTAERMSQISNKLNTYKDKLHRSSSTQKAMELESQQAQQQVSQTPNKFQSKMQVPSLAGKTSSDPTGATVQKRFQAQEQTKPVGQVNQMNTSLAAKWKQMGAQRHGGFASGSTMEQPTNQTLQPPKTTTNIGGGGMTQQQLQQLADKSNGDEEASAAAANSMAQTQGAPAQAGQAPSSANLKDRLAALKEKMRNKPPK